MAIEAQSMGHGGLSLVAAATGVSPSMIRRGLGELADGPLCGPNRQRRVGGGRKSVLARDAQLLDILLAQIDGEQPGCSPASLLLWASASAGQFAARLTAAGHRISAQSVTTLLHERGYTLRATRAIVGPAVQKQYADRYQYVRARIEQFVRCGQPVVYVRAQRSVYHSAGERHVRADSLSAEFILLSVRFWWQQLVSAVVGGAKEALVVLDAEIGSAQLDVWHFELKMTAKLLGTKLQLCTLPPAVHRLRSLHQQATFSVDTTSNGGQRRAQTSIIALAGEPSAASPLAELRQRLYRRYYPRGLIETWNQRTPFCIYSNG